MVANKADLLEKALEKKQLEEFCKELNAKAYFQTSALTGEGVNEAFMTLTTLVMDSDDADKMTLTYGGFNNSILNNNNNNNSNGGRSCAC